MEQLVSIIVPVYNVERYLLKCLSSICSQTYRNLEIIVVDDCSTDGSSQLCDSYAARDSRLKVIHLNENHGQAYCRNRGLDIAKGELIGFVDSDDWINTEMYSTMVDVFADKGVDIVICGHNYVYENGLKVPKSDKDVYETMDTKTALQMLLSRRYYKDFLWDKLFRRCLFDEIRLPEEQIFEDTAVMYKLFALADSVSYVGIPLYNYFQRPESSIRNSEYSLNKMQIIYECERMQEFFKENTRGFQKELQARYISANCLNFRYISTASNRKEFSYLLPQLKKNILRNMNGFLINPYGKHWEKVLSMSLKFRLPIEYFLPAFEWLKNRFLS